MTKSRLMRWSLILVTLAAFAVWLEPTRVAWGWLRGEAFYQGRPTSYWAEQIRPWKSINIRAVIVSRQPGTQVHAKVGMTIQPESSAFRKWLSRWVELPEPAWPSVLDGYVDAEAVLNELNASADANVRQWAHVGLQRLGQSHETGPNFEFHLCYTNGKTEISGRIQNDGPAMDAIKAILEP
jgi:hypothetical protein